MKYTYLFYSRLCNKSATQKSMKYGDFVKPNQTIVMCVGFEMFSSAGIAVLLIMSHKKKSKKTERNDVNENHSCRRRKTGASTFG